MMRKDSLHRVLSGYAVARNFMAIVVRWFYTLRYIWYAHLRDDCNRDDILDTGTVTDYIYCKIGGVRLVYLGLSIGRCRSQDVSVVYGLCVRFGY